MKLVNIIAERIDVKDIVKLKSGIIYQYVDYVVTFT